MKNRLIVAAVAAVAAWGLAATCSAASPELSIPDFSQLRGKAGERDKAIMTSPVLRVSFLGSRRTPVALTQSGSVYALGTPALRAAVRDRWPRFRKPATPEVQSRLAAEDTVGRVLAILHGPGEDIFPSVRPNFFAWATSAGVVPVLRRTFISPAGTRVFEVYSLEPKGSKATPAR